jgi:hypothetical protein
MLEQKVDRTRAALRVAYGLVPIIAGADKFANVLCDWERYLSPLSRRLLPVRPSRFMKAVGVIEMGAGALVLSRYARLGGYVVGGWLGAIALQLVTARRYDIAVRDAVMALGAITLARLTEAAMEKRGEATAVEREPLPGPPIPRDEAFAMYSGT